MINKKGVIFYLALACLILNDNMTYNSPSSKLWSPDIDQPRSQSFVPLDQRWENDSSGSNHFEITKEITEFWLSGSLRSMHLQCMPEMVAPRAIVSRSLVKGNEALGTRLEIDGLGCIYIFVDTEFRSHNYSFGRLKLFCLHILTCNQLQVENCTIATS